MSFWLFKWKYSWKKMNRYYDSLNAISVVGISSLSRAHELVIKQETTRVLSKLVILYKNAIIVFGLVVC